MRAGMNRALVTLETLPDTPVMDSGGQPSDAWTPLTTRGIRARIEPLSGRELLAAQQVNAEVTTRITIRWRPLVTSRARVVHAYIFHGAAVRDVYNVMYPIDLDNRHVELQLMCATGLRDG